MTTNEKFEQACEMLMSDDGNGNILPEITNDVQNLFYDNFGMSAEEISEALRGHK